MSDLLPGVASLRGSHVLALLACDVRAVRGRIGSDRA